MKDILMISIIIAVFNGGRFIEDTIYSALSQTVPVELIVIDDHSTDDSYSIIKKIANENSQIKIIRNEQNLGFCRSVNVGLKMACGEYVLVLGQDDILAPNHAELMLEYFDDGVSIVFCDYDLIDENGIVFDKKNHCIHSSKTIKDFYKSNPIPSVGLIINKNNLISVGGYPENQKFPQYGEYHTWIRMALQGKVVFCEKVRAKYRKHTSNMTNNFSEKTTKRKLNRYYNYCARQFLTTSQISLSDKCYIFALIMYRFARSILL